MIKVHSIFNPIPLINTNTKAHLLGPKSFALLSIPESELNVCQWLLKHGPKDEDKDDMHELTEKTSKVSLTDV